MGVFGRTRIKRARTRFVRLLDIVAIGSLAVAPVEDGVVLAPAPMPFVQLVTTQQQFSRSSPPLVSTPLARQLRGLGLFILAGVVEQVRPFSKVRGQQLAFNVPAQRSQFGDTRVTVVVTAAVSTPIARHRDLLGKVVGDATTPLAFLLPFRVCGHFVGSP